MQNVQERQTAVKCKSGRPLSNANVQERQTAVKCGSDFCVARREERWHRHTGRVSAADAAKCCRVRATKRYVQPSTCTSYDGVVWWLGGGVSSYSAMNAAPRTADAARRQTVPELSSCTVSEGTTAAFNSSGHATHKDGAAWPSSGHNTVL